jgi:hypothetical protein
MSAASYPFVPKSTTLLMPGQFWGILLSNGHYACGRVLAVCPQADGRPHSRHFVAGLLDWYSEQAPNSENIAGRQVLKHGAAHIKTITRAGGQISGHRPLELDAVELAPTLHCVGPRNQFAVVRGSVILRLATPDDDRQIPYLPGWGPDYIRAVAEHLFVTKQNEM